MRKPVVSVVIPVYNTAEYINKCLSSVCSQTYGEWEVLAVDDGSTDDSFQILGEWSRRDNRVRCFHKLNEGVVAAREFAVDNARGEYLFFLDSDDWLPDDALQTMVDSTKKAQADICVGSYTLVFEDSKKQKKVNHRKSFRDSNGCFKYCLKHGEMFLPIKLYKTSVYREFVHIPNGIIVHEDVVGVTQYLEHCDVVTYTDQSVYFYYKHPGTATARMTLSKIQSMIKVADFLLRCKFCGQSTLCVHLFCAMSLRYCMSYPSIDDESLSLARRLMSRLTWTSRCVAVMKSRFKSMMANVKKLIKR